MESGSGAESHLSFSRRPLPTWYSPRPWRSNGIPISIPDLSLLFWARGSWSWTQSVLTMLQTRSSPWLTGKFKCWRRDANQNSGVRTPERGLRDFGNRHLSPSPTRKCRSTGAMMLSMISWPKIFCGDDVTRIAMPISMACVKGEIPAANRPHAWWHFSHTIFAPRCNHKGIGAILGAHEATKYIQQME